MERDGEDIPAATPIIQLRAGVGQAFVLVRANMRLARLDIRNKAVKKTLTIPKWLDQVATDHHVNFSQVLQEALKNTLGIPSSSRHSKSQAKGASQPTRK